MEVPRYAPQSHTSFSLQLLPRFALPRAREIFHIAPHVKMRKTIIIKLSSDGGVWPECQHSACRQIKGKMYKRVENVRNETWCVQPLRSDPARASERRIFMHAYRIELKYSVRRGAPGRSRTIKTVMRFRKIESAERGQKKRRKCRK